jgi:hypothetical protein
MSTMRFEPSSYLAYPSLELVKKGDAASEIEEIDTCLNELKLEKAKWAIYRYYGNWSLETQKNLLKIIDKLVELNVNSLPSTHEQLNYTLEAAHSLGCHMYTIGFNKEKESTSYYKDKYAYMGIASVALKKVAEAYAKKNDYCHAVDSLRRLDDDYAMQPMHNMFARWKTHIENNCPHNKQEEFLYQSRLGQNRACLAKVKREYISLNSL